MSRIEATENIEVRLRTEVARCLGSERLEGLELRSTADGSLETVEAEYLFAFLGAVPRTGWLDGQIACDGQGFILAGSDLQLERDLRDWPLARAPFMLESSVPGIFACGDARCNSVKRVASAVGEGSVSVSFVHQVLAAR